MTNPTLIRAAADLIERRALDICTIRSDGSTHIHEPSPAIVADIADPQQTCDWYTQGGTEDRQMAGTLDGIPVVWIEHRPLATAPRLSADAVVAENAS